jgi:hypothetical protein
MCKFSGGAIPEDVLFEHDTAGFVNYQDLLIPLNDMRNSGEPGTLPRNFLANFALAKIRMEKMQKVFYIIKGDNVAIFSSLPRSEMYRIFEPIQSEGKIEIDPSPEWTSYRLITTNGHYYCLPNYSYIGERIYSNAISATKHFDAGMLLNYKVLYRTYEQDLYRFKDEFPESFNVYSEMANSILFDEYVYYSFLVGYKLQLFNKRKQKQLEQKLTELHHAANSPPTTLNQSTSGESARQC